MVTKDAQLSILDIMVMEVKMRMIEERISKKIDENMQSKEKWDGVRWLERLELFCQKRQEETKRRKKTKDDVTRSRKEMFKNGNKGMVSGWNDEDFIKGG